MDFDFPTPLGVEPKSDHKLTVILLHGRGSCPEDFCNHFRHPSGNKDRTVQSLFPNVKRVFPSAENSYSSVFQEEVREWFDIWSLTDVDAKWMMQLKGLGKSSRHIRTTIEQETKLFERQGQNRSRRIVLGGISMGCAVGVHAMLSLLAHGKGDELGGFLGWCGWVPLRQYVENIALRDLKMMYGTLGHVNSDGVVGVIHGRNMSQALAKVGMRVKWTEYESQDHWVKELEAVDELGDFLRRHLASLECHEIGPAPSHLC